MDFEFKDNELSIDNEDDEEMLLLWITINKRMALQVGNGFKLVEHKEVKGLYTISKIK